MSRHRIADIHQKVMQPSFLYFVPAFIKCCLMMFQHPLTLNKGPKLSYMLQKSAEGGDFPRIIYLLQTELHRFLFKHMRLILGILQHLSCSTVIVIYLYSDLCRIFIGQNEGNLSILFSEHIVDGPIVMAMVVGSRNIFFIFFLHNIS